MTDLDRVSSCIYGVWADGDLGEHARSRMKNKCSILVVHDGMEARDKAVRFCDKLVGRFWESFNIDLHWFDTADLSSPAKRHKAAELARCANATVIAQSRRSVPAHIISWAEHALLQRQPGDAFLVFIPNDNEQHNRAQLQLRTIAHRAQMDFLMEVPPSLNNLPEGTETYVRRAQEVSGVLLDILKYTPMPANVAMTLSGLPAR